LRVTVHQAGRRRRLDRGAGGAALAGGPPGDGDNGSRSRDHAPELERAAHAAVPEPLHDRLGEGVVVALQRAHVSVALVDSQALVGLQKRRVPDHVGEHHRDEPTIEPLTHNASSPC
jgi:hypothetical protein